MRGLSERLPVQAVMLTGSVARGDFNVWSDIDVVVVAESLPERLRDRLALLHAYRTEPGGPAQESAGARCSRLRHPAGG